MYTVSQWKVDHEAENGKLVLRHVGNDWQAQTVQEAKFDISTLKISGARSVFVIEDESGVVEDVVNRK